MCIAPIVVLLTVCLCVCVYLQQHFSHAVISIWISQSLTTVLQQGHQTLQLEEHRALKVCKSVCTHLLYVFIIQILRSIDSAGAISVQLKFVAFYSSFLSKMQYLILFWDLKMASFSFISNTIEIMTWYKWYLQGVNSLWSCNIYLIKIFTISVL